MMTCVRITSANRTSQVGKGLVESGALIGCSVVGVDGICEDLGDAREGGTRTVLFGMGGGVGIGSGDGDEGFRGVYAYGGGSC